METEDTTRILIPSRVRTEMEGGRETPNTTLTGRERRDDVLWRIMHRMKSSLSPTFLVLHGFLTSAGDRPRPRRAELGGPLHRASEGGRVICRHPHSGRRHQLRRRRLRRPWHRRRNRHRKREISPLRDSAPSIHSRMNRHLSKRCK